MKHCTIILIVLSVSLATAGPSRAQNGKVTGKIIETGLNDNRVMEHLDVLSNTIGGRPVGSHALEDAEMWAADLMRSWGLEVTVEEVGELKTGFNRGPWFGRMLDDSDGMSLHFTTPSYTAGTKGPQTGRVYMEPRSRKDLDRMKGVLPGAWVLVGGRSTGWPVDQTRDTDTTFYKTMAEMGVLGFIQSARTPITTLYDRKHLEELSFTNLPKVPDIKLDEHQYETIKEKVLEKRIFFLEFDIRNHFSPKPVKYHNIIGALKGTKHPDEYVIISGHLDAFDVATGSVDDGNGSSVTLEAARLLTSCGARPERTILFCLWTGEEFGLWGSKYYVEHHMEQMSKISNLFNRDGGPLAATSVTVPEAMYDDFVQVCKPLTSEPDLFFPFTVNKRTDPPSPRPKNGGHSDYAYFAEQGVPTISFRETDPAGRYFDYREIWHTERDLFYQCPAEYLRQSALVTAVTAFGIANLPHLLSREGAYAD